VPLPAPDPTVLHPIAGQQRVVFLRALVQSPTIEVGEYTYYDSYGDPLAFEREAVLYGFGPERLIIGRFCAIASGVRFLMPGANADRGPSTFPFGVFGPPWDETMDLVMSAPSRGDTVIGHDVWLGYSALVLPGVTIGHGAVVAGKRRRPRRPPVWDRRRKPRPARALPLRAGGRRAPPAGRVVELADRAHH
jgi:virginiamycin A acetyltransferase